MNVAGSQGIEDFDLDEVEDSIRKCEAFLAKEDFELDFAQLPTELLAGRNSCPAVPPAPKQSITTDDGVGLLKRRMDENASLSMSRGDKSCKEDDASRLAHPSTTEIAPKSRSESHRAPPNKPIALPKSASSGFLHENQPTSISDNPLAKRALNLLPRKREQGRGSVSSPHDQIVTSTADSAPLSVDDEPISREKNIPRGSEARSSTERSPGSTTHNPASKTSSISSQASRTGQKRPQSPAGSGTFKQLSSQAKGAATTRSGPSPTLPAPASQTVSTPKRNIAKQSHPGTPEKATRTASANVPRAASTKSKMALSIAESRLEAYLREKEERELKECTFHPKILTKKHPRRATDGEAPEDRLRNEGERKRIEHEKMRIYKERAEFEVCTFKPELSARTEKIMAKKNMKPIYERYNETMEQHRHKVEELMALAEAEKYYPEIDEKARMRRDMLAQKALTRSGIDPFAPPEERLYSPGARRSRLRSAKDNVDRDAEEAIECSFKPQINPESSAIAQKNTKLSGDFFQRQNYYNERKMHRIQAMERSETQELTFQPQVRRSSSAGMGARKQDSTFANSMLEGDRDSLDGLPVHERLYKRSVSRSRNAVRQQQDMIDLSEECRFVPEINKHSKTIGRKSTIDELYQNTVSAHKRDALCRVIDEEQQKECTFKPTIHSEKAKAHYNIQRPESLLVQIEMERQQKAVKLNMLKKKLEYDEVQTCSFKPEIKTTVPKTVYNGPTITQDVDEAFGSSIKGLGRFMEKQEQARKKQEEQKLRESKVFGLNPSAKTGKPYTVPQPFNLSYETSARKSAFERERIASSAFKDYTFQPQTSEQRVKDLVAHILSNDE